MTFLRYVHIVKFPAVCHMIIHFCTYMFFTVNKMPLFGLKLVLEIIRKLQTRMLQLTIHQYTKTKAATIFYNAIKITVYLVR